jgi:PAS domain S-box-containing protein
LTVLPRLRPLIRVALPVAIATVFVCLAVVNLVLARTWRGEPEDGALWADEQAAVVARLVHPGSAADRAGLRAGDRMLSANGRTIRRADELAAIWHATAPGGEVAYVVDRPGGAASFSVTLDEPPRLRFGLFVSLSLVGMLALVVGASVRLRRPADAATLHFFWLTVAFFGTLAFTPTGRYDRLDYFFEWADVVARLALPPLFLHFAFVFPERPAPWVRTVAGRFVLPACYLPAFVLGAWRVRAVTAPAGETSALAALEGIEVAALVYLAACLLAGLGVTIRALGRIRSVTARRQLRWIVWGSSVGAVPFVGLYVLPVLAGRAWPGAEYTAVLLGCVPLAFASAIVRYRLMDVEVILRRTIALAAVGLLLAVVFAAARALLAWLPGFSEERTSFWALFATLIVALVAPRLRTAVQAGLDRLYFRDRYDYRRALVTFTRDLNADLDLDRLSSRLVKRIADTLAIDRLALYLRDSATGAGRFVAVATGGTAPVEAPPIDAGSALGARLADGQTVHLDEGAAGRRLAASEAGRWREAGLFSFIPCVSSEVTVALIAAGRRGLGEPLSSEDLSLLGTVAGQVATAIENARLYSELQGKAAEIERLRQFGDSVVESLSDGLVVVDLDDRVLRWNRRAAALLGPRRDVAVGQSLGDLLPRAFLDTLGAARRDAPDGTALYRVPLPAAGPGGAPGRDERLVNIALAPFQTPEGAQAGWILVFEDVTDRAHLEEQVQLSEKMAAIGLLAAGVAHEVNTPLTGISSFTQMLLERADPADPRTELLEKIERQTFRAAKIVNSLLNLARPTSSESAPVDLNTVITDVLALVDHQFKLSHVQVTRELSADPVMVVGVEYKLQQVFLNLCLNARDAMPAGGRLAIRTRVEGRRSIVEVADTGTGIPAEHLARIYDPFFTTKGEGRGTGLGLAVSYGIVKEHGGSLICDSVVGQGTRFRLEVPAHRPPVLSGSAP